MTSENEQTRFLVREDVQNEKTVSISGGFGHRDELIDNRQW
jgi:hypothetical protein